MSASQDIKNPSVTVEDVSTQDAPAQSLANGKSSTAVTEQSGKTEGGASTESHQPAASNAQPLAPPPKPSQTNGTETPDFFSLGTGSHFSREPNPFEQSFGVPTSEAPGKFGGLPSVASLQSPAPLGPGKTPGWPDSLRSGPLSPAMLAGPANTTDYFSEHGFGGFPTPNESSLRTGLTPGGTGSMFPAPSPNSQAIFNSMQSGGATPSTLDFHRTAMQAAARSKAPPSTTAQPTSQGYQPAQQTDQSNMFSQPEGDAANSLYMLATRSGNANQFAQTGNGTNAQSNGQSQNNSPTTRRGKPSSGGNSMSDMGDFSGSDTADQKSASRSKGKKSNAKAAPSSNGRRKAEETPSKPNKRAKAGSGGPGSMDEDMDDDDEDDNIQNPDGTNRKMTDEEKRKNFLERNRVAALKCRQRKKQWLANLQNKVEIFSAENDALSQQVTQLREEIVNLKTLLLAHKDCPVSHQQGLGGAAMQQVIGDIGHHANPYGMLAGAGQMLGMGGGPGMQRA